MKKHPWSRAGLGIGLAVSAFALILHHNGLGRAVASSARGHPISADQAAKAMQSDDFFVVYAGRGLLVQGKVASISKQDDVVDVVLDTSVPTKVLCHFASPQPNLQTGQIVQVQSDSQERTGSYVAMQDCRLR